VTIKLLMPKDIADAGDQVINSTVIEETTGIAFPVLRHTSPEEVVVGVTVIRPAASSMMHDKMVVCAVAMYVENTDAARQQFLHVRAGNSSNAALFYNFSWTLTQALSFTGLPSWAPEPTIASFFEREDMVTSMQTALAADKTSASEQQRLVKALGAWVAAMPSEPALGHNLTWVWNHTTADFSLALDEGKPQAVSDAAALAGVLLPFWWGNSDQPLDNLLDLLYTEHRP